MQCQAWALAWARAGAGAGALRATARAYIFPVDASLGGVQTRKDLMASFILYIISSLLACWSS